MMTVTICGLWSCQDHHATFQEIADDIGIRTNSVLYIIDRVLNLAESARKV